MNLSAPRNYPIGSVSEQFERLLRRSAPFDLSRLCCACHRCAAVVTRACCFLSVADGSVVPRPRRENTVNKLKSSKAFYPDKIMIYFHLPGAAEAGTKMETGKNVDCEDSSMKTNQRPTEVGTEKEIDQNPGSKWPPVDVELNESGKRTTARAKHAVRTTSKN